MGYPQNNIGNGYTGGWPKCRILFLNSLKWLRNSCRYIICLSLLAPHPFKHFFTRFECFWSLSQEVLKGCVLGHVDVQQMFCDDFFLCKMHPNALFLCFYWRNCHFTKEMLLYITVTVGSRGGSAVLSMHFFWIFCGNMMPQWNLWTFE